MLKKSLIVLAILAMALPVVASEPEQTTDKLKKYVDEKAMLKSYGWPISFEYVDITGFLVPVKMDVGLFLEILNMKSVIDEGIYIKQPPPPSTTIDVYEGCSIPMKIKCNFKAKFEGKIVPTQDGWDIMKSQYDPDTGIQEGRKQDESDSDYIKRFWKVEIRKADCSKSSSTVDATLCTKIEERTIWVQLKKSGIVHHAFGKKIKVADVQVRVKPAFDAQWEIPCPECDP